MRFEGDELHLSKIFDWYGGDFGKNDLQVASTVKQWLRGQRKMQLEEIMDRRNFRIRYLAYDWTVPVVNAKAFKVVE